MRLPTQVSLGHGCPRPQRPTPGWLARALLALAVVAAPGMAWSQEAQCTAPAELDNHQLLRRLSLDLRGRVPSMEEYAAVEAGGGVTEATVQSFLQDVGFRQQMRRYHEALFWPNLAEVRLRVQDNSLNLRDGEPAYRITASGRATAWRGHVDVDCGDFQQTQFIGTTFRVDPAGVRTSERVIAGKTVTIQQEGWREVNPWWSPTTKVKVCAYDAQEAAVAAVDGKQVDCKNGLENRNTVCGCGPAQRFCYPPRGFVPFDTLVREDLREQLGRAVDDVTVAGQPYTDLVLSRKVHQNGRLAFWKRNLASNVDNGVAFTLPDPDEEIAAIGYNAGWTVVDRMDNRHAGVLTTPAYLLKFQTNRGRANRFRIDFACAHFEPPKGPPLDGCVNNTDDLMRKCVCNYCHSVLEPLAAHWGLFAEAGTTLMTDLTMFPRNRPVCTSSPDALCRRFYVTDERAENPGALLPLQWGEKHPVIVDNARGGPRAAMVKLINDRTFARCTVRRLFTHFMRRPPLEGGAEKAVFDELVASFENGWSFPALVARIVSLPQYRRAR